MTPYRPIILLTSLLLSAMIGTLAQRQPHAAGTVVAHTDSVQINFAQSKWDLDLSIGDNAAALESIDRKLSTVLNDSVYRLRHVSIYGGASPEGSVSFNKMLSENRAETLFGWFDKYNQLTDLDKTFTYFGRDWEGVLKLAESDMKLPYRDETLALLRNIVNDKRTLKGEEPKRSLERVKQLRGGVPYQYLYRNIFPKVRASKVVIDYERVLAPDRIIITKRDTVYVKRIVEVYDTIYIDDCKKLEKNKRLKKQ